MSNDNLFSRQQPRKFQGQELKHMNPRITLVQENSFLQPAPPRSTRHPQQNRFKVTGSTTTTPIFRYRTSPTTTTTRESTDTYTSLGSSSTFTKSSTTTPSTVEQSTAFQKHVSSTFVPTSSPKVSTNLPSTTYRSSTLSTTKISSNDSETSVNVTLQYSTEPVFSSQKFVPSVEFENIELKDAVQVKDIEDQTEIDNENLRKVAY